MKDIDNEIADQLEQAREAIMKAIIRLRYDHPKGGQEPSKRNGMRTAKEIIDWMSDESVEIWWNTQSSKFKRDFQAFLDSRRNRSR